MIKLSVIGLAALIVIVQVLNWTSTDSKSGPTEMFWQQGHASYTYSNPDNTVANCSTDANHVIAYQQSSAKGGSVAKAAKVDSINQSVYNGVEITGTKTGDVVTITFDGKSPATAVTVNGTMPAGAKSSSQPVPSGDMTFAPVRFQGQDIAEVDLCVAH